MAKSNPKQQQGAKPPPTFVQPHEPVPVLREPVEFRPMQPVMASREPERKQSIPAAPQRKQKPAKPQKQRTKEELRGLPPSAKQQRQAQALAAAKAKAR